MKKIGLLEYLEQKQTRAMDEPVYRHLCTTCLNPEFSCYCETLRTFDPQVQFVILIHPIEFQRRIATGRMSHLILKNSLLIRGHDYSQDEQVNQLIDNPDNHCVILYPGRNSVNLSEQKNVFPLNKKMVVFVIDGTWATARQMMRTSENLKNLPQVCFTPVTKSNFRVRKQPEAHCLSTIEAIHHFIEIAADQIAFDKSSRSHDVLLQAFNTMVERQISFAQKYA